MMFMVFGNYHPDWQCLGGFKQHQNSSLDNSTLANQTLDILVLDRWLNESSGLDFNDSYWNRSTPGSCDSIKMCQDIGFNEGSNTIVTEWDLICDLSWVQSIIIFIQMIGVLIGSYYGSLIGDKCGRRVNLYISVAFHTVFSLLAAFSVDWKMFACLRFFIGLTVGGMLSCCLVYPIEFVSKWWRGFLSTFPVWNFGAATFSLVVLLLKNWKHVHIATALFSLLVFLLGFWVPESMRWLALQGKVEKAKNIANMVAAMNHRPPPNTTALEIFAKEERKKLRAKGTQYEHVVDMLKKDKYFSLSLKMGLIWACMSLMYYTISFGMKFLAGNFYINFIIFSVAEIPGIIFVNPISRRLGPRLGSLVYFVLIFLPCVGLVITHFMASEDNKGNIIFYLALLAKMNILAAWKMMTNFSSLMYPSEVSCVSTDYLNTCARIGAIISPFLIPNITGSLYVMFLILAIYLLLCCLFLVSIPLKMKESSGDEEQQKSQLSVIVEETELEVRYSECDQDA
ncbi:unnamed protein product [Candidula unifasciata]|uniref:Major facilitator superfamily (MFS) profile domain-containing protein n=1 Tax=Candidula unifasciata TaxID=100452 RepID=A0A8S4A2B5_9EUPU|nr:unnamed protein product [Candidula unifasciata]